MKSFKSLLTLVILGTFAIDFYSCSGARMQASPVSDISAYPSVLERAKKKKKDFIMCSGVNYYTVLSLQLEKNKRDMTVQLNKLDSLSMADIRSTGMTARSNNTGTAPKVYLFMRDSTSYTLDEPHTIPLANVSKIAWEDPAAN